MYWNQRLWEDIDVFFLKYTNWYSWYLDLSLLISRYWRDFHCYLSLPLCRNFLLKSKQRLKNLLYSSERLTKFSPMFVNICHFLEAELKSSKIYCFNESFDNTGLSKAINYIWSIEIMHTIRKTNNRIKIISSREQ